VRSNEGWNEIMGLRSRSGTLTAFQARKALTISHWNGQDIVVVDVGPGPEYDVASYLQITDTLMGPSLCIPFRGEVSMVPGHPNSKLRAHAS